MSERQLNSQVDVLIRLALRLIEVYPGNNVVIFKTGQADQVHVRYEEDKLNVFWCGLSALTCGLTTYSKGRYSVAFQNQEAVQLCIETLQRRFVLEALASL